MAIESAPPVGLWHARLVPAPGHEVAFSIRVEMKGDRLAATLVNGTTESPFTLAAWDGETLSLELAHFDARLSARRKGEGLEGTYRRNTAAGTIELPFEASHVKPAVPSPGKGAASLAGEWAVEIGAPGQNEKAEGLFRQSRGTVIGTLRTTTGDYGSLHGTWDGKDLVLQSFDGVHVYRFTAAPLPDGSLAGDFRSGSQPPAPWRARRLAPREAASFLPTGFSIVKAKSPDRPFIFSFPDADGKVVSSTDPGFSGRPMLVSLMGTWCPNCNDEAPVLRDLARRYGPKGLAVVSLAFEYTDDVERSRRQVKSFRERYGIDFPILIAGTTKSAPTSPVIAQLKGWEGYPTAVFLDRLHRIVKVHSGFDGPATGDYHARLKREFTASVENLLR